MAGDQEWRDKLIELIGEGSTRRIHLAVLAALVLSGIVLHGLASLFILQAVREYWAAASFQVWPFTIVIWILIVGLLSADLWRRLKGMSGRGLR